MSDSPVHIIISRQEVPGIALVRLNRPKAYNALCKELLEELVVAFQELDQDPDTRCIVLTGNERAFAAGADISELADKTPEEMVEMDLYGKWEALRQVKTPVIAAVSGFALGGGCELAMICDMIIASHTAKFGQPEIRIGVMPGAGGTQRLTKAVGKAIAMEMVLAGRFLTAKEAATFGLVNKVVPREAYLSEALKLASTVASMPPVAAQKAKDSVLQSFALPLNEGLAYERKSYTTLYATEDQKEGMHAFLEKRKPEWKGK